MRTGHRLDILILAADKRRLPDGEAFERLSAEWLREGILVSGPGLTLHGGPQANRLVCGGFHTIRLDLPGTISLYASQQGGFRVGCPNCSAAIAREFSRAMERFRLGGADRLTCNACGHSMSLEEAQCMPAIGLASGALILMDVGSVEVQPRLTIELSNVLGPSPRIVLRRAS